MSAETFGQIDSQESVINNQEKQQEALGKETDRLYNSVNSFDLDQMQCLVDNLSDSNPDFQNALINFQDTNSTKVVEMLKSTSENSETNNTNFDYFGIDGSEITEIQNELEALNLDINKLLEGYKNYIETNLTGLSEEQKEKIITSIANKILTLGSIIEELKADFESGEKFSNNRWIINEKIQDSFSNINDKVLPSLALLSKINSGETTNLQEEGIYDIREQFEEIQRMLGSDILTDGDFDKTWRSGEIIDANTNNWNILDINNETDSQFLSENGITGVEGLSLLKEKDKQIETTAQYTFYALLAVQIGLEFTPIGWTAGAGIDGADVFTDEDVLLTIAKSMPWVNNDYKAEKTWVDNTLAGVGLIPGATILTKAPKLTNWIFELDPSGLKDFMQILDKSINILAKKFGWEANYIKQIRYYLEGLFLNEKQGLPLSYLESLEKSGLIADKRKGGGVMDIPSEYRGWEKKGIPYKEFVNKFVKNNTYGVSLEEAHAIYGYTNGVYYLKLNNALENAKTPEEIEKIMNLDLVKNLVSGLKKFPFANEIQYRGHHLDLSNVRSGDKIPGSNQFLSSGNKTTEPMYSNQGRSQLVIYGSKAIDISELAFFVHHADRLGFKLEKQESVFLPGTILKAISNEKVINNGGKEVPNVKAIQEN